jgi:hypothetical protein
MQNQEHKQEQEQNQEQETAVLLSHSLPPSRPRPVPPRECSCRTVIVERVIDVLQVGALVSGCLSGAFMVVVLIGWPVYHFVCNSDEILVQKLCLSHSNVTDAYLVSPASLVRSSSPFQDWMEGHWVLVFACLTSTTLALLVAVGVVRACFDMWC